MKIGPDSDLPIAGSQLPAPDTGNARQEGGRLECGPAEDLLVEEEHDSRLEAALRDTLGDALHGEEEPSPGFADRVLARALAGERAAPTAVPFKAQRERHAGVRLFTMALPWAAASPGVRALHAAAATLAIAVAGGAAVHTYWQHERAAEATRHFEQACRIEAHALEHTRQQLAEAGIRLDQ